MLWAAGQKRQTRELRDARVDRYVAHRDGYVAGLAATGQLDRRVRPPDYVTAYLADERTVQQRGADSAGDLARLMHDFPGNAVKEPLEFRN
jgi:hypothetical protein